MKSTRWILSFMLLCFLFNSCQKELSIENGAVVNLPTITTISVTSIATTTSTSGGDISSDGGDAVTARGVCWNTTANPVVTDSHTTDGTGIGTFVSNITALNSGTTYHVRAYATNSAGTAYGNDVSFTTTTTPGITIPTLTTTAISSITATSSASGGNISSDGGAAVSARGVCWSTSPAPVVTGNHTTDGTGIGAFTSSITGLTAGTVYYVRAYATNTSGTAYGNEVSFTTSTPVATLPILTTTAISSITSSTASGGGNISSDGGAAVTVRGVCWGTVSNPVATGNHTTDGTGIGTFVSSITGLTANTTYHVRAYATNSVGTAYGNDLNFTSSSVATPDVYIAGDNTTNAPNYIPMLWKNGVATTLPYTVNLDADAESVFVSGTDVYVAGEYHVGTNEIPVIWKNGVATALSTPSDGIAESVFVSGTDVYVAGQAYNGTQWVAAFWKNGVETFLPMSGINSEAHAVYVSGTDVYVVGYESDLVTFQDAVLWKNGVRTLLSNGFEARSVFVSGTIGCIGSHMICSA